MKSLIVCGTKAGYYKHLRNKEPKCQPCKDALAAHRREYYKKNAKVIYERTREWAKRNPDKVKEYSRKNNKKNYWRRKPRTRTDKTRANDVVRNSRYRARKRRVESESFTVEQVLKKYGTDCYLCWKPIDLNAPKSSAHPGWEMGLHLDHWIPVSKGGPNTLDNIRPLHGICNIKKQAKIIQ